ncbi:MAG: histidine ammonia-lyase [Phycisphaeraceae bacterium]|nr:MAG: histidine ammonia-lyase [Phycisphaeraceae bacterium]
MAHHEAEILLGTGPLAIDLVLHAARGRGVRVGGDAASAMLASRAVIEGIRDSAEPHYGINTGFGSLSRKRVSPEDLRDLQRNLVRSHAAGVGEPLPTDVVRAMMVILAGSLARGMSGVRPVVVETIAAMLNACITPIVPSLGSVGASGDLAPLAHVACALIGEGEVEFGGKRTTAAEAMRVSGIQPLVLEAKEGLALINGTHLMAAQGVLLCAELELLTGAAIAAAAMSIDASRGTDAFLDPRVHEARCQPGQKDVAARVLALLKGSEILPSHAENDPRVQDPYSLRCMAQVIGAATDCFAYVRECVERELGAVTDNPLVFAGSGQGGGDVVSAGNFHGMPLAVPLDVATIGISHIAGISERRTFWMLSAFDAESHLRPYLSPEPGLNSGLMIAQYTAAALCNEIIGLATPASVANIVTSAGIEDYNSFGPRAAAKARRAADLAMHVVAIELICAAQGIEAHRPLKTGKGIERVHEAVRRVVPALEKDRSPAPDIEAAVGLIRSGEIERAMSGV